MNIRRTLFVTALLLLCHAVMGQDAGTVKWFFTAKKPIVASPALSPDETTLYVGSLDGNLYALDTQFVSSNSEPAEPLWALKLGAISAAPVVAEDGTIYVGTKAGMVYSITPDGETNWQFRTRGAISGSPAIDENGIVYVPSRDGLLYAFDPEAEEDHKLWTFDAGADLTGTPGRPMLEVRGARS